MRERRGKGGRGVGHWVVKSSHVTSGNSLPWICLLRSRGLLVANPIHQNLCPYPYLCPSVLSLPASQGKWNSPIPSSTHPSSPTRLTHSPIPMPHIPLPCPRYIHATITHQQPNSRLGKCKSSYAVWELNELNCRWCFSGSKFQIHV